MAVVGTSIKIDTTEGMDKITQTEKVTSPYFSDGSTELLAASIVSTSLSATNEKYFFGICNSSTATTEEFNVAFGSLNSKTEYCKYYNMPPPPRILNESDFNSFSWYREHIQIGNKQLFQLPPPEPYWFSCAQTKSIVYQLLNKIRNLYVLCDWFRVFTYFIIIQSTYNKDKSIQ